MEDPNDGFTDMRDLNDVRRIAKAEDLSIITLPLQASQVRKLGQKYKLSQVIIRSVARLMLTPTAETGQARGRDPPAQEPQKQGCDGLEAV